MKKLSICLVLSLVILSVSGQEREFNKLLYGFQLVKFHEEFGFGVHLLTPEYKNLRINVKTNLNWLSQSDAQVNETWTEF